LPSMRLFGNADVNKTVSQTNIFYNHEKIPDYYYNEYPQLVYFKMQDPLSISFGWMYQDKTSHSDYFITLEYFAAIKEYLSIDPTIAISESSTTATSFSAYQFGNNQVLNIALGYKKMLSETLGFLVGLRTDFNPYIMRYNENLMETNSFEALNINLYHLTGGVKFDYKKSSFIVGLQHSFSYKSNQKQFVNFSDPVSYNPDNGLALQGERKEEMDYIYASLGIYLGFSISF
ncbi:MAG: hypothetical protein GQ527_03235, partial [Bacteroidales bacterium]|nr:hypothetical protein [Bacteroidales bacterium]